MRSAFFLFSTKAENSNRICSLRTSVWCNLCDFFFAYTRAERILVSNRTSDKWTNEPKPTNQPTDRIGKISAEWKEAERKTSKTKRINNYENRELEFYVSIGIKHVSLRVIVQKTLLLSTHCNRRRRDSMSLCVLWEREIERAFVRVFRVSVVFLLFADTIWFAFSVHFVYFSFILWLLRTILMKQSH